MTAGLPEPFPGLQALGSEDRNPAIRLFGRRFFTDQGVLELLAELMAVALCEKRRGGVRIHTALPEPAVLADWPAGVLLQYRPPIKLNLKLFAFLTASRIDTRHPVHEQHYEKLVRLLEGRIRAANAEAGEVVEWLEELLRGFQGAGLNRTWCAQTFFPITSTLLTRETIWSGSAAKALSVEEWDSVIQHRSRYFETRRDFLARGGELLYLQMCNALVTEPKAIGGFLQKLQKAEPDCLLAEEADPQRLHALLEQSLSSLRGPHGAALDRLIEFIEGLDPATTAAANRSEDEKDGWLSCAWCPKESWREGYLFAVELSRVLRATLDPVERLELLTTGCALQVLRSLCAQSARYAGMPRTSAPLGYAWVLAPPEGAPRPLRLASQRNLQVVQSLIQRALRTEALKKNAEGHKTPVDRLYREADSKYGHKLFLSLGKKLGFIVPKRGPGARFTMTDEILRYLVLALLPPGGRCTSESFRKRLYLHYGMVVDGDDLTEAVAWSGLPSSASMRSHDGHWLEASLRAGGFLTQLSDAWSIVHNTNTLTDDL